MSNATQQSLHAEDARRRFGLECARLREKRQRTRIQVAYELRSCLGDGNPLSEPVGEVYIGRIENGQVVKLYREIVEGLSKVLLCTPFERARLLLYADLNIIGDCADDEVAEIVNYFTMYLFYEAHTILKGLSTQRRSRDLSEVELFKLLATALDLIQQQHSK